MTTKTSDTKSAAFTLVEIMIVVAIIGVLAVPMIPGLVKSRKQAQGRRIMNDVCRLDAAINHWAVETVQSDGATVNTTAAATYLKSPWNSTDVLGNQYTLGTVGTNQIAISSTTKTALSGAGIDWGAY
jgi:prepilin-type N-terminal cleavage/methylation domain-containing protein